MKPSTLLRFHRALTKRKYRRLSTFMVPKKPGPKGHNQEVIAAVVAMKQRNPTWGCPRIAQQIALAFGIPINFGVHCGDVDGVGPRPFVERLIGTLRRECLDRMLFWSATDLERKLSDFQAFYNAHRAHASLDGRKPIQQQTDVAWWVNSPVFAGLA